MIEVICVTYGQDWSLKCLINSFKAQVNPGWFLRVIHDGRGEQFERLQKDLHTNDYLSQKVLLESTPERYNDYGHSLRNFGLENPVRDSDFTLITNGDNYYLPTFIEEFSDAIKENPSADFILCNYIQKLDHKIHGTTKDKFFLMDNKFQEGFIDMGSAVVKTEIARSVGFKHTSYNGDFLFFADCLKESSTKQIVKIPQPLFVHI